MEEKSDTFHSIRETTQKLSFQHKDLYPFAKSQGM